MMFYDRRKPLKACRRGMNPLSLMQDGCHEVLFPMYVTIL